MALQDPRTKNELPPAKSVTEYLRGYTTTLEKALLQVAPAAVEQAFALLENALLQEARIFVAGNGGSAAIADHLCCDWLKGTYIDYKPALQVQSLVSNVSLFTALANDFGYEESFARQLEMLAKKNDVAVLISSSGNSPNIVKAAHAAHVRGLKIIGMTGFSGGKLKELSDVSLHVPINNYGIAEDCHQMLMHAMAQYLAQKRDQKA